MLSIIVFCLFGICHETIAFPVLSDANRIPSLSFESLHDILYQWNLKQGAQVIELDTLNNESENSSAPIPAAVRLTHGYKDEDGYMMTNQPILGDQLGDSFEWIIEFSIHQRSHIDQTKVHPGQGIALWITLDTFTSGPNFGHAPTWDGLAIFLDTNDNLGEQEEGNNRQENSHTHPYISAMLNDGTLEYFHDKEGTHSSENNLVGCQSEIRSKHTGMSTLNFAAIRIQYNQLEQSLSVSTISQQAKQGAYLSTTNEDWQTCFTLSDITFDPHKQYYFSISGSTSSTSADIHDIIRVQARSSVVDTIDKNTPMSNKSPSSDRTDASKSTGDHSSLRTQQQQHLTQEDSSSAESAHHLTQEDSSSSDSAHHRTQEDSFESTESAQSNMPVTDSSQTPTDGGTMFQPPETKQQKNTDNTDNKQSKIVSKACYEEMQHQVDTIDRLHTLIHSRIAAFDALQEKSQEKLNELEQRMNDVISQIHLEEVKLQRQIETSQRSIKTQIDVYMAESVSQSWKWFPIFGFGALILAIVAVYSYKSTQKQRKSHFA